MGIDKKLLSSKGRIRTALFAGLVSTLISYTSHGDEISDEINRRSKLDFWVNYTVGSIEGERGLNLIVEGKKVVLPVIRQEETCIGTLINFEGKKEGDILIYRVMVPCGNPPYPVPLVDLGVGFHLALGEEVLRNNIKLSYATDVDVRRGTAEPKEGDVSKACLYDKDAVFMTTGPVKPRKTNTYVQVDMKWLADPKNYEEHMDISKALRGAQEYTCGLSIEIPIRTKSSKKAEQRDVFIKVKYGAAKNNKLVDGTLVGIETDRGAFNPRIYQQTTDGEQYDYCIRQRDGTITTHRNNAGMKF